MLRRTILRGPATVQALRSAKPAHYMGYALVQSRYNSSKTPKPTKAQEAKLTPDWDAPKLTYEQVKPRTEQPSPVRSEALMAFLALFNIDRFRTHISSTYESPTRSF